MSDLDEFFSELRKQSGVTFAGFIKEIESTPAMELFTVRPAQNDKLDDEEART